MPKETYDKPVFDWELSLKLANNKADLAKEMLSMLVQELPEAKRTITDSYEAGDNAKLRETVHRLHGACCYCGVPRLKDALYQLEFSLKNTKDKNIAVLIKQVEKEITALLGEIKS